MGILEQILEGLAKELNLSLQVDAHNCCKLRFRDGFSLQLELNRSQQFLLIGADLGPLAPGSFRENVLIEALKENGLLPPKRGVFAYSERLSHLILFEKLAVEFAKTSEIKEIIMALHERGGPWQESIRREQVPQANVEFSSSHPSIFDTKR